MHIFTTSGIYGYIWYSIYSFDSTVHTATQNVTIPEVTRYCSYEEPNETLF